MPSKHNPPLEIRLRVLSAVDHAPGESIRARIRQVATLKFTDQLTGQVYQFTWRTVISQSNAVESVFFQPN